MSESKHDFPNCLHSLAAAMHMQQIDPRVVEITLPFDEWWKLYCVIEARFRGLLPPFDGRQNLDCFRYMGFEFKPRAAGK